MNKGDSFVITMLATCSGILLAALVVLLGYGVIQWAENSAAAERGKPAVSEAVKQQVEKSKAEREAPKMTEAEMQNALEELHKKSKGGN